MGSIIAASALIGGASFISSFSSSEAQRRQQKYSADIADYQAGIADLNAKEMQRQAQLELQKGQIAKAKTDQEKSLLTRQYNQAQGANINMLANSGAEISGSFLDFLDGQASYFANDVATNRYNYALADWESKEQARQKNFQSAQLTSEANTQRSNASYLRQTAGNIGKSLLTAGISGLTSGFGTYMASGSSFGSSTKKVITPAGGVPTGEEMRYFRGL